MTVKRSHLPAPFWCVVAMGTLSLFGSQSRADSPPPVPVLEKPVPENADDLKALQRRVRLALEKVVPCTVCVRVGGASGSGVIVSKDGYVLTAGHVSGQPNRDVAVVLPDGKIVKGKTLGGNHGVDTGLIKITDKKDWGFVEMGKSADLKKGQWCLACGHPGGFREGRTPPVRLGRILAVSDKTIQSDCTVVGGDSGGPLFDLDGKVIGIHSRIGESITANIHVPVDAFRGDWDRMVKAETWGRLGAGGSGNNPPVLGVRLDGDAKGCKIAEVMDGTPAAKGGLKVNDVITTVNGRAVANADELGRAMRRRRGGDEITLEVVRGMETVTLKVTLARQGS